MSGRVHGIGVGERRGPSLGDRVLYLLGAFGLAACLASLWLGMRAVMNIGGACASGGAHEISVPCPDGLDLVIILAFPLGFLSAGVIVWKGAALGGSWIGLAALAWPALFLSLGWNFIEYGLRPPYGGDIELGWLIPGVLFLLMGGIPLLVWLWSRGDASIVPGVPGTRARSDVRELRDLRDAMARAARQARSGAGPEAATMTVFAATHQPPPGGTSAAPVAVSSSAISVRPGDANSAVRILTVDDDPNERLVSQLERLTALHETGALSIIEFQQAKAALLAGATETPR